MSGWKIIGRSAAGLAALIVLAVIGGYFYLRSNAFRQFAMRKIVQETDQATGGRAQIGTFDFHLLTLTANLYNVVLRGSEPSSAPPLLQVEKLTVGLRIQSALHRKISLSKLLIEHPVVYITVDRAGNSNLPIAPPSKSNGHANIFELAVGHLGIHRGEIDYHDQETSLEADIHDFGSGISFDSVATRYQGSIFYRNGQIRYGRYQPLPNRLSVEFTATPSRFSLASALLTVGSSAVSLHADVTNYRNPEVAGDYALRIHTQDFADMLPQQRPSGDVLLIGKIHYQNADGQSLLRSIRAEGQIASDRLIMASPQENVDLTKLRGKYRLAEGSLKLEGISTGMLGGEVDLMGEIRNLGATPIAQLQLALHRVSLLAVQHSLRGLRLTDIAISGSLDGTAAATWTGSLNNLRAHSDITVYAEGGSRSTKIIPVDGAIHVAYDGKRNIVVVKQTTLRLLSTTLTVEGQLGQRSNLNVQATSSDLRPLIALGHTFHPKWTSLPLVSGSATLRATLQDTLQNPQIAGRITAQNLHVDNSAWKTADVSFQANRSRATVSKGALVSARRGSASFTADVRLHKWSYNASSPLQASLALRQMPLTDLQQLANVHYPVSGDLSAKFSVSGSQLKPAGKGSLEIAKGEVYGQPLKTLAFNFHSQDESIVTKLNIVTDAGAAEADLTYTPSTKAYKIALNAPGVTLQKLRAVQDNNLAIDGTLSISVNGEGTVEDPQLVAVAQIPQLSVQQKAIGGVKAEIHIANKSADLRVNSQVAQASVQARAHVNLTGDFQTDASIDTGAIPLDTLLAAYANGAPEGFKGQTELHATLKGPLKDKSKFEGNITIPNLSASYRSLEIGAVGPIRADYVNSVVTLQPAEIRGTDTSLKIQGSIPLAGESRPTLTAEGSIDARIVPIVAPAVRSSGSVALDVRTLGTAVAPQIEGRIRLQDISMTTVDAPLGVEQLNGTLDLKGDRVQISSLSAVVGGGKVSVGGSIRYRPNVAFDLALQGEAIRLRYPQGLRSILDTNLTWSGTTEDSTLVGRVLIDSLSFTPDFDLASFGDQFSSSVSIPSAPGFADTVNLRVTVQSKDNLKATSTQVNLEGSANLNVSGSAANPVITGRTDLTSGELFYRNVRYQLERGIITFDDPNQTRPVLNVSVSTTIEQYSLTLNLRGPFDQLTTSYSSDPPLATADIINLIARGKTSSELADSSQSTDSILASQAASQFSSSVQKLAGISSLEIDPLLGGNDQNPSARLALQQRITKNFLFTFSTDVTEPGQEIVQGDYQISKRWSLSVERDQVGGISVDGRFHTRF